MPTFAEHHASKRKRDLVANAVSLIKESGLNGTAATLTMSAGGAVAGTNLGCTFTGTALPRASGKNVFDVSVTFGAAPCALPGQTATGIAITYAVAGTAQKQLLVAVQSSTKANGTMFIATR